MPRGGRRGGLALRHGIGPPAAWVDVVRAIQLLTDREAVQEIVEHLQRACDDGRLYPVLKYKAPEYCADVPTVRERGQLLPHTFEAFMIVAFTRAQCQNRWVE